MLALRVKLLAPLFDDKQRLLEGIVNFLIGQFAKEPAFKALMLPFFHVDPSWMNAVCEPTDFIQVRKPAQKPQAPFQSRCALGYRIA